MKTRPEYESKHTDEELINEAMFGADEKRDPDKEKQNNEDYFKGSDGRWYRCMPA